MHHNIRRREHQALAVVAVQLSGGRADPPLIKDPKPAGRLRLYTAYRRRPLPTIPPPGHNVGRLCARGLGSPTETWQFDKSKESRRAAACVCVFRQRRAVPTDRVGNGSATLPFRRRIRRYTRYIPPL